MSTGPSRTRSKQGLLVGVTGGIGSGKSEVCRHFAKLGRVVISADEIARELTEENPEIRRAVKEKFGIDIYDGDGRLKRKVLAAIVFAHPSQRRVLNAIVHPMVFGAINAALEQLPLPSRVPYVIVEAALVFESGMDKQLAATVLVRTSPETCIQRVMERDGTTRQEALGRMKAQMSLKEKLARADFIIENDGSKDGLPAKVAFVDRMLSLMLRTPGSAGP